MKQVLFFAALAVLLLLSMPALKLGGSARLGQLAVLGVFALILTDDIAQKRVRWEILLFFWIGAALMTLVSLNSIAVKFGETKFIIKYFLIFPASYYVGAKIVEYLSLEKLIFLLELTVFIFCLNALLIDLGLIPDALKEMIVSYRTAFVGTAKYLEYQGTFAEAGWFAIAVETTALFAILLRYDFNIWPSSGRKWQLYGLYGFVLVSLALSKNKTVWIGIVAILLFLMLYKGIVALTRSNYYMPEAIKKRDPKLSMFAHIDTTKLLFVLFFLMLLFFIVNALLPEPIITAKMLEEKLQNERGKAFVIAMHLLEKSGWLGGYGFGFVEAYFTLFPQGVIGLGEGTGMIFNSYLDIWLSASLVGLAFHLLLLYFSFSSRYYVTMAGVVLLFVYANFNPAIGDEYYYIFMGLSYGIATCYHDEREV